MLWFNTPHHKSLHMSRPSFPSIPSLAVADNFKKMIQIISRLERDADKIHDDLRKELLGFAWFSLLAGSLLCAGVCFWINPLPHWLSACLFIPSLVYWISGIRILFALKSVTKGSSVDLRKHPAIQHVLQLNKLFILIRAIVFFICITLFCFVFSFIAIKLFF